MGDRERPTPELLVAAVEAALFASDEPVLAQDLARAFGGLEVPEIETAIAELETRLDRGASGLRVERIAGGVRLSTRTDVGPWVRRYFRQRNRTRLSAAGLETLAVVAYRQPVTAPEIQAIRGKDPTAALKTLLEKKMVRLLGKKKVVGSPLLYGTTRQFLLHFGLNSLEDLPSIEEFDELLGGLGEEQAQLLRSEDRVADEEIEPLDDLESDGADGVAPNSPPTGSGPSERGWSSD